VAWFLLEAAAAGFASSSVTAADTGCLSAALVMCRSMKSCVLVLCGRALDQPLSCCIAANTSSTLYAGCWCMFFMERLCKATTRVIHCKSFRAEAPAQLGQCPASSAPLGAVILGSYSMSIITACGVWFAAYSHANAAGLVLSRAVSCGSAYHIKQCKLPLLYRLGEVRCECVEGVGGGLHQPNQCCGAPQATCCGVSGCSAVSLLSFLA